MNVTNNNKNYNNKTIRFKTYNI